MMPPQFDPYHEWLGIPADEQPPNHYRLLGIPVFEQSSTVISHAADRQMAHLRTFQTSGRAAVSQELLNEVTAAKICLLNVKKKAAYDQALRAQLQSVDRAASSPAAETMARGLDEIFAASAASAKPLAARRKAKKPHSSAVPQIIAVVGVAVVGAALALWWSSGRDQPSDNQVAKAAKFSQDNAPKRKSPPPAKPSTLKPDDLPATARPLSPKVTEDEQPSLAQSPPELGPAAAQPREVKPASVAPPAASARPEDVEPRKKIDPPSAEQQKPLLAAIDEVYQLGAANTRASKAALARKLLEDGQKNTGNRAEQFAMLRRAGEIARDSSEPALMLEAVDSLNAAGFAIRPFRIKSQLLLELLDRPSNGGPGQLAAVAASAVKFAEAAAAGGAVEDAENVLDAARAALIEARKQAQKAAGDGRRLALIYAHNPAEKAESDKKAQAAQEELETLDAAANAVAACSKTLQQAKREQEAVQAAQQQLTTNRDDPQACLTVGRWLCFTQDDWDAGLNLLAKGSDEALQTLARRGLEEARQRRRSGCTGRCLVGPGREGRAPGENLPSKTREHWYRQALPDMQPNLVKARIEKRLTQAGEQPAPPDNAPRPTHTCAALAVAPFDAKTAAEHQETWARHRNVPVEMVNAVGMQLKLIPPGEFAMGELGDSHKVTISKPFYLGKYEVSQEEWTAVMGGNPAHAKGRGALSPK